MKENKKGFTIIELLAVIVLLGVIITIAALSLVSISNAVKNRQKENLKARIIVAAQRYVSATGITKVYVETLIKEGVLKSDNESESIIDPVDNSSMNCDYVDYTNENNPVYEESDTCDSSLFNDTMLTILYCAASSGGSCIPNQAVTNQWISGVERQIILGVKSNDTSVVNLDPTTLYSWISPLSPDVFDLNKTHLVKIPDKQYINDVYEIIVTQNAKAYSGSARIKIDAKEPIVRDFTVSDNDTWKKEKIISATLEDKESGLAGFIVTRSVDVPAAGWTEISGNNYNLNYSATQNGTYYIWVKDQAGNINKSTITQSSVVVKKIDRIAPTCTADGDNYSWTKSDVTIKYGCLDGESGCNPLYSGGENTFTTTTYSATIDAYIIKDRAGNETFCPSRTASVYVDKTAPSITSFNVSSNDRYNSNNTTASLMGSDSHSGIDKVCLTLTNNSNTCAWIDVSNNYYSTDYKFASSNGSGDSHILYAFIKDKVGNISSVKSYYYRLYRTCDSTTQTLGGFTACSKVCGGGEQSQILNLTDRYFGTSCGTKQSGTDSCNTQDCCSSTYEVCGSALACSTTCGSGTASKFCETYSQYNGKFCKSYFKNTECNESYGCYVPSPDPIVPPTPDPVLPPTPDPVVPPTSCYLIAHCYKNVGDKYEIHLTVTGGCTLKSHFSTNCPHYDYSNTRFYVTAANGTTCQGVGAYFSNGVRASNNLRIHDGRGEYFSLTQYLPINKCTS
ncbi:MAG: type II secretion system protein [Firmicutes bacterium]|nr:type II secretion system protein [Bacillota bacterium]